MLTTLTVRTTAWSRRVWKPVRRPIERDFARMYTSFLKQPGGLEVQLVKYDVDTNAPVPGSTPK